MTKKSADLGDFMIRRFIGARKVAVAVTSIAIASASLIGVAGPASAGATGGTISPTRWAAGSTSAVNINWTNSATSISTVMVRSPWPWTATYPNGGAGDTGLTPTGRSVTCTTIGATFTFSAGSTVTGPLKCTYINTSNFKSFTVQADTGGTLTIPAGETISVSLQSGVVIAPSTAQTDTWLIGESVYPGYDLSKQMEVATTSYLDANAVIVPTITIDFDGNGGKCITTKLTSIQGTWGKAPKADDCSRPGFIFKGWNTSANGSGTGINPEGNVYFTGDNRVYAQWTDISKLVPADAPTNVVATGKYQRVKVTWNPPAKDGGMPITNYLVQSNPGAKICITSGLDGNKTECEFTNLTPGTQYTFFAQALNGIGWGAKSSASNAATPSDLRITKYERKKGNLFSLFKSEVKVTVATPGYAAGTKLTPMVKVGDGNFAADGAVNTNSSGSLVWTKKFEKKYDASNISIKFVEGEHASNMLVVPAVGWQNSASLAIVRASREKTTVDDTRISTSSKIVVMGKELGLPLDSEVGIRLVYTKWDGSKRPVRTWAFTKVSNQFTIQTGDMVPGEKVEIQLVVKGNENIASKPVTLKPML